MKTASQRINSEADEAEDQIRYKKNKKAENTQSEEQKEKRIQKYEDNIISPWDNFKYTNICIMGVPKGKERARN